MSASDFHFSLMDNEDSLQTAINKRKVFYIIVQNLTDKFIPQVKVELSGPPDVKLLIRSEIYGGIPNRISKKRVFKVLSNKNGTFPLTAKLTSGKGHKIELPIKLQVEVITEVAKPISLVYKPEPEKKVFNLNCPYCGDKIDDESKFCPHCGSNLVNIKKIAVETQEDTNTKRCQNCGTELSKEAKYCAKCGQNID